MRLHCQLSQAEVNLNLISSGDSIHPATFFFFVIINYLRALRAFDGFGQQWCKIVIA